MARLNSKGQSSEVFKLLIGSIIGLAIIVIIYSLITQISSQKEYLEDAIFYKKIEGAIRNPTGSETLIEKVNVKSGSSITNEYLGNRTGLGKECFSINNPNNDAINYIDNQGIVFKKDLKLDFIIKCEITNEELCQITCNIKVAN